MLNLRVVPAVALLSVGGTIDKIYGSGAGITDLHCGPAYAAKRLPPLLGPRVRLYSLELMRKDSTEMTDADRAAVVAVCQKLPESAIIITHGTDTLVETAAALAIAELNKTIVLTGSLQPAAMAVSDADFNLGMAVGAVHFAKPGVYVALNGVAPWRHVKKDPNSGRFIHS